MTTQAKFTHPEAYIFTADSTKVYHLCFHQMAPTEGLSSLLKHNEQHGIFMRKEHVMCADCEEDMCPRRDKCRDVHLQPGIALASLKVTLVHRNIPGIPLPGHDCHVPGTPVEYFDHKTRKSIKVDSGNILKTEGSISYLAELQDKPGAPRMQQCTHFQRKHCLRGETCLFLHVLQTTAPERLPPPVPTDPGGDYVQHKGTPTGTLLSPPMWCPVTPQTPCVIPFVMMSTSMIPVMNHVASPMMLSPITPMMMLPSAAPVGMIMTPSPPPFAWGVNNGIVSSQH